VTSQYGLFRARCGELSAQIREQLFLLRRQVEIGAFGICSHGSAIVITMSTLHSFSEHRTLGQSAYRAQFVAGRSSRSGSGAAESRVCARLRWPSRSATLTKHSLQRADIVERTPVTLTLKAAARIHRTVQE